MRKLVLVTVLEILLSGLAVNSSWASEELSCGVFLLKPTSHKSVTVQPSVVEQLLETKNFTDAKANSLQTLEGVKSLLEKAKAHGFFTKSKYDHLLDDLNELENVLDKKTNHESFNFIMGHWTVFLKELKQQFDAYLQLSPADQKLYFAKMQLPLTFMTSHFVTFLETSHLKFKYQRMAQVLKSINAGDRSEGLTLFLYHFEKQVLKFFSLKEFLNCQA